MIIMMNKVKCGVIVTMEGAIEWIQPFTTEEAARKYIDALSLIYGEEPIFLNEKEYGEYIKGNEEMGNPIPVFPIKTHIGDIWRTLAAQIGKEVMA